MNLGRWVEVRYRPDSGCASLKTRSELATADAQLGIWEAVAVREATDLYVHRRVDRFLFFPTVSSICKKRLRIVSTAAFLLFCQEDLCSSSSSSSSLFYAPILLEWTQTLKAKEEKRNRRREQQLDHQTFFFFFFFFFFWLLHLLPDSYSKHTHAGSTASQTDPSVWQWVQQYLAAQLKTVYTFMIHRGAPYEHMTSKSNYLQNKKPPGKSVCTHDTYFSPQQQFPLIKCIRLSSRSSLSVFIRPTARPVSSSSSSSYEKKWSMVFLVLNSSSWWWTKSTFSFIF